MCILRFSQQVSSYQAASITTAQRRNGLEQAAKAFSTLNKVTPENGPRFTSLAKQREEALINEANSMPVPKPSFANRVKYGVCF